MKIMKNLFLCTLVLVLSSLYSCNSCKKKNNESSVEDSIDHAVNKIEKGMDNMGAKVNKGMHNMGDKVEKGMNNMGDKTVEAGQGLKNKMADLENWKTKMNYKFQNEKAEKLASNYWNLSKELAKEEEVNLKNAKDAVQRAEVRKKIDKLKNEIFNVGEKIKNLDLSKKDRAHINNLIKINHLK